MNGYAPASVNMMPGSTTVGQNSGGTVCPHSRISHDGNNRVEPSRNIMYQSGCEPEDTWDGIYGPNNQTGLICARPPSAAQIPNTRKKKPPAFAAYSGNTRSPLTVCSVLPWPAKSLCFCRTTSARC